MPSGLVTTPQLAPGTYDPIGGIGGAPLPTSNPQPSILGGADINGELPQVDVTASGLPPSLGSGDISGAGPTLDPTSVLGSLGSGNFGTDASTTAASAGSTLGTIGSDIGSVISGIAGSNLGTLAAYGGLYSILANQASAANNQNQNLAGQITAIGQPDVAAGTNLLQQQQSGQLAAPYASEVSVAQQQNQQAATSQMQQVAQLLANAGGGNVQSAMASEGQQITSQQALANTQAVTNAFTQELSDSLNLTGTGGGFVQSGITQEIQSNTQLQGQLSELMGMLANAYAKQVSGSGSGTGTGAGGTGAGSVGNSLSNLWNQLTGQTGAAFTAGQNALNASTFGAGTNISNLESSVGAASGSDINSIAGEAGNQLDLNASDLGNIDQGGDVLTGIDSLASDSSYLGDVSTATSTADDLSNLDNALSFSSAGGQAAAPGAGGVSINDTPNVNNSLATNVAGAQPVLSSLGSEVAGAIAPSAAAAGSSTLAGEVAGSTIGGAVSEIAGPVGLAASAIGDVIAVEDPRNTPDAFNPNFAASGLAENPYGALPSGNDVLTAQNIGIGGGTDETKGSGQIYQINPQTGQYEWIGQNESNALEQDFEQYATQANSPTAQENASISSLIQNPITPTQTSQIDQLLATGKVPAWVTPQPQFMTPEQTQALANINQVYEQTGGEAGWGVSQSGFDQQTLDLLSNIIPGTYFGGVGQGFTYNPVSA